MNRSSRQYEPASRKDRPIRTLGILIAVVILCGATAAGAAKLITGADVKNGSLGREDLNSDVQRALPIRVTGGLPTQKFSGTTAVKNTKDGVSFGPYANGGVEGGSLCTSSMNGQPFSDVKHLAYVARYTSTGDTGGVGVPYLRVFLKNDHDAIFSPNTQSPDPDMDEGPFHTWVATAGSWRYDDDAGSGPDSPFKTIRNAHATQKITEICVSTGFSAGTNLSALLRSWEINSKDYAFGL
jgi:hypothetical protein